MGRCEAEDLIDIDGIVTADQWSFSQLSYVAGEVVDE
jgi:hypothetical protein